MKALAVIVVIAAALTGAQAQQARTYAPPDRELWDAMVRALSEVPMSISAHQNVQRILSDIQREAQTREAAKAKK